MNKRFISLLMVMIMVSMTVSVVSVQAASKKAVYVCNKITLKDYSDDTSMDAKVNVKYTKKGLVKALSMSAMNGFMTAKYKFVYGKSSNFKKGKYTIYTMGVKYESGSNKFTYNKKGYLVKQAAYNGKGKKTEVTKYKFNSKGFLVQSTDYTASGKVKETRKFKVNSKGQVVLKETYNKKGTLEKKEKSKYSKNKCMKKTYDKNNKLTATIVIKYKHKNPVSITKYDDTKNHKKLSVIKTYYKKIKTSKYSAVKRQQYDYMEQLMEDL